MIPRATTTSSVLKALAVLVALPMIAWGVFMCFLGGWGEPGPAPYGWRLLGFLTLFEGSLYCVPNSVLVNRRLILKTYLALTSLPICGLVVATVITIATSGFWSFLREAALAVLIMGIGYSFAPISLIMTIKPSQSSGGFAGSRA
jgi:hypothetical protein